MTEHELLEEYSNAVRRLKQQCSEAGMSNEEFKKIYFETLQSLQAPHSVRPPNNNRIRKYTSILLIIVTSMTLVYNYKSVYSCIACNVQEYIYPGLRLLRKLAIPIISLFPSLTSLYHETCLIQNPFFSVADMDCWPCSSINTIGEIQDPKPVIEQNNPPFIYKSDQNIIQIEDLKKLYLNNTALFDKEASRILSDTKAYVHPIEMFDQHKTGDKHSYIWKYNTMNMAKVLRQIIPRPKVVPKFGQSTERFIIVDNSQKLLKMPDTECSFSFLLVLSGDRTVQLTPAEECKHQCKALTVDLKESYLLWYNWWYWRPVLQHSNGNTTFIAHVGSYC